MQAKLQRDLRPFQRRRRAPLEEDRRIRTGHIGPRQFRSESDTTVETPTLTLQRMHLPTERDLARLRARPPAARRANQIARTYGQRPG